MKNILITKSLSLCILCALTFAATYCAKKERGAKGQDTSQIIASGQGVLTGNDARASIEFATMAPAYKGESTLSLKWIATATPSTNASFQTAMTLDGGENWALSGGLAIASEPLEGNEFSMDIILPAGDHANVLIRIGLFDDAGLRAIATSDMFSVDSTPPHLTTLSLNEGDDSTLSNYVRVKLEASDLTEENLPGSKISHFCLLQNTTVQPETDDDCWQPVDAPWPGQEKSDSISFEQYYYTLGFTPGMYEVTSWVRDQAGHVSSLVSGQGQSGVDLSEILFTPGAPPSITNVIASSTTTPSSPMSDSNLTAASGSTIYIKWRATDPDGFMSSSFRLEYSTDSLTYTTIASNLSNGSNSGCTINHGGTSLDDTATGCYTWSNGSPTSSFLAIRVVATDLSGFIGTGQAVPLNTAPFRFLAGNTDLGIGGSARAGVFIPPAGTFQALVVLPNGVVFYLDQRGLLTVNPTDGVIKLLAATTGTMSDGNVGTATLKNPVKIIADYSDNLLIADDTTIRRLNTKISPMKITTLTGSGSQTADGIDPLNLKIDSGFAANSTFISRPNGDIFFQSGQYAKKPSQGAKIRYIRASDNTIQSIAIAGLAAFMGTADQDISECILQRFAISSDLSSQAMLKIILNMMPSGTSGRCFYQPPSGTFYSFSSYIALEPTSLTPTLAPDTFNYPSTIVNPFKREHTEATILTGMDGKVYGIDHGLYGRILQYDQESNEWKKIAGTTQQGECSDGFNAINCAMRPRSLFVSGAGEIYFQDGPLLRTIHNGKVYTIGGQSLSYGDGGRAVEARFGDITSIQTWGTKVTVADRTERRIREFTLDGTISNLAGNGVYEYAATGSAAANSKMRWAVDVESSRLSANSNGDMYTFKSRPSPLSFIARATGLWTTIGSSFAGYGTYVFGQNASKILVGNYNYCNDILAVCNTKIFEVAKSNGSRTDVLIAPELVPTQPNTNFCADGTSLSSCIAPSASLYAIIAAQWDTATSSWLTAMTNSKRVVKLAAGGTMSTLVTLPRNIFMLATDRSADLSTNILYYCGTNSVNRYLYKYDLNTSTETLIPFPLSTMSCAVRGDILLSTSRDSLIFNFTLNGLQGVAEIVNP